MGRTAPAFLEGERVALAIDWQWGDRYLRAGLRGTVVGHQPYGRVLVRLDCFTPDSTPQLLERDQLEPAG